MWRLREFEKGGMKRHNGGDVGGEEWRRKKEGEHALAWRKNEDHYQGSIEIATLLSWQRWLEFPACLETGFLFSVRTQFGCQPVFL